MKILYFCTFNRRRSILSEAITNHYSDGNIGVPSAGSQHSGEVPPLSIKYLEEAGIPATELQSQSWDEFESLDPDIVVTSCDSAAGEACPVWFGQSLKIHCGLEDPSKLTVSDESIANAFRQTIRIVGERAITLKTISQRPRGEWKSSFEALGRQS